MEKGVEEGMRLLPNLYLESTQSSEENSSFSGASRSWTLEYIKQLVKNIYSFLFQRPETFRVGRKSSNLTASFHRSVN